MRSERGAGWMAVKILKVLACVVLAVTLFGWVTRELWNWVIPPIFGLRAITFWQAIGLILLGKILFGGFHKHGYRNHWDEKREWKRRMKTRWETMSDEERTKFRAGMKGRCGWGRGDWGGHEPWASQMEEPTTTEGAR